MAIENRFMDYLKAKNKEYLDTLKNDEGTFIKPIDGKKLGSIFCEAIHDFLEENLRADVTWVGVAPGTPPTPDVDFTGATGLEFKFSPFELLPALSESELDAKLTVACKTGLMQLPTEALFATPTVPVNPAGMIVTTVSVTAAGKPIKTQEDAEKLGEQLYREIFTTIMSYFPLPLMTNRAGIYQGTLTTANFYFKD